MTDDELNVLASVNRGSANDMTWKLYDQLADKRHDQALMYPETHGGVEDVDGSDVNKAIATLYQRYYQAARIVEMVRWWKYDPPPVMEIAYCGIQAGFGSVVAAVVSTLEMNARRQGGRSMSDERESRAAGLFGPEGAFGRIGVTGYRSGYAFPTIATRWTCAAGSALVHPSVGWCCCGQS